MNVERTGNCVRQVVTYSEGGVYLIHPTDLYFYVNLYLPGDNIITSVLKTPKTSVLRTPESSALITPDESVLITPEESVLKTPKTSVLRTP